MRLQSFLILLALDLCASSCALLNQEKTQALEDFTVRVDDVISKDTKNSKFDEKAALFEAVRLCKASAPKENTAIDYAQDEIVTKKGSMTVAKADAYCQKVAKKLAAKEVKGCGQTAVELVGKGTGADWGTHSLHHPQSRGSVFTGPESVRYKPIACTSIPAEDKIPADVAAYSDMIKGVCGEKSTLMTQSAFGTTRINDTTVERNVIVYCYMKEKRKWFAE